MRDKNIDSRVILMGRSQKHLGDSVTLEPGYWLTLGHFDWAKIELIKKNDSSPQNPPTKVNLADIWNNNSRLSIDQDRKNATYWHPIYIVREFDELKEPDMFWAQKAAFMLICQIRSKWTSINNTTRQVSQVSFEYAVDECVSKTNGVIFLNDDTKKPLCQKSCYIRYRTLALSDIVLILKSDSLRSLMDILGNLQALPCVGDLYSYCCINPCIFDSNPELPVTNDSISLMSIRFSIRNTWKSRQYLTETVGTVTNPAAGTLWQLAYDSSMSVEEPYFITGTEDINLQIKNLTSQQLCRSLQCLLQIQGYPSRNPKSKSAEIWDAFDDMVTRLGIPENRLPVKTDLSCNANDTDLKEIYGNLLARFQKIMKDSIDSGFSITNYDWIRPIAELLEGMKSISGNNLLRQFCFVMLGGMVGIVDKCEEISADWKNLTLAGPNVPDIEKKNFQDKLTFVMLLTSRLANLMENMVRMEGELVHHPETRPLLFFIPANLLEFYMSFTDRCIRYYYSREDTPLQSNRESSRKFLPLLVVPELCETIQIANQPDESRSFLLSVSLPVHLLYDPFSVICNLVHEAAHCAGEDCRCREERFDIFIHIAAYLIVEMLGMSDSDRVLKIIEEAKTALERLYPEDSNKRYYMRNINTELPFCIDRFLRNDNVLAFLSEIYLDLSSHRWENEYQIIKEHRQSIYTILSGEDPLKLLGTLSQVSDIFRESYADLGMVSLLSLKPSDYVKLFSDYDKLSNNAYLNDEGYKGMIARIAAVICTMASDDRSLFYRWIWCDDEENEKHNELEVLISNYCRWLLNPAGQSSDSDNADGYPLYVMLLILKYLKSCKSKMDELDSKTENLEDLKRIQTDFCRFAIKQEFASDQFIKALEEHRSLLCEWATYTDNNKHQVPR